MSCKDSKHDLAAACACMAFLCRLVKTGSRLAMRRSQTGWSALPGRHTPCAWTGTLRLNAVNRNWNQAQALVCPLLRELQGVLNLLLRPCEL